MNCPPFLNNNIIIIMTTMIVINNNINYNQGISHEFYVNFLVPITIIFKLTTFQ